MAKRKKSSEEKTTTTTTTPAAKRRSLSKPLARESEESKAAMASRMRLVRLERAVERLGAKLRAFAEAKPATTRKRDPNKLWGAARPWEEVEAAKTRDYHDDTEDLVSKHGRYLCDRVREARDWRDALVDLASIRIDQGRLEDAKALCQQALAIDAADARGAGITALDAGAVSRRLENDDDAAGLRCVPAWTRVLECAITEGHPHSEEDLDDVNPFAKYCVAFPAAFDACLEYADDIGDAFAPGGKLEALKLHHLLRHLFFSPPERKEDRRAIREGLANTAKAMIFGATTKTAARVQPPPAGPEEAHKDAVMYATMFDTAMEMALSSESK